MITYIDCGSGVAGDMLLGALIGLGLSARDLESVLRQAIPVKGWRLRAERVERRMWPAWSITVQRDRPFKSSERMLDVIRQSRLPAAVRNQAAAILKSLQSAERKAHGKNKGVFDSRGLGRLDTLIDVIGCSWGFWKLGIAEAAASALNTGRIAPATTQLLAGARIPVFSDSPKQELATPTGTAILSRMAIKFEPMPLLQIEKAGFGAGTLERNGKPNVLAIYRGTILSKRYV